MLKLLQTRLVLLIGTRLINRKDMKSACSHNFHLLFWLIIMWWCHDFFSSDDFRLFCGDLGNEVTDDQLTRAFSKYPSFLRAKVVRDKKTNKTKGYGFVSFKDPNDFIRAMREMNGELSFHVSSTVKVDSKPQSILHINTTFWHYQWQTRSFYITCRTKTSDEVTLISCMQMFDWLMVKLSFLQSKWYLGL